MAFRRKMSTRRTRSSDERAIYKGYSVAVLERGRKMTTIRTPFGFVERVPTKDLRPVS
jgi:hypothetical protein